MAQTDVSGAAYEGHVTRCHTKAIFLSPQLCVLESGLIFQPGAWACGLQRPAREAYPYRSDVT